MRTEISSAEAVRILSSAFAPLHCGAEEFDFSYVRFRVFDSDDDGILKMARLTPADYGSRAALKHIIEHARANLERRGHILDPWAMPSSE